MIGNFARKLRHNERIEEVALRTEGDGYDVVARQHGGPARKELVEEGPPDAFVQPVASEGGTVYLIPFMEAFISWLQERKNGKEGNEVG